MSPYRGIDKCDRCGRPLEKSGWLSGLCEACEEETSKTKSSRMSQDAANRNLDQPVTGILGARRPFFVA